jgi:hypothetical protein
MNKFKAFSIIILLILLSCDKSITQNKNISDNIINNNIFNIENNINEENEEITKYTQYETRDTLYNYIGFWRIVDYFRIDGLLDGYITEEEAEDYRGEIIEYKVDAYIFRNNLYQSFRVDSVYLDSEQLRKETRGGGVQGTRGYDFSDLNITDHNEVRAVLYKTYDWNFGRAFYVLNNNRIIVIYMGFFFLYIYSFDFCNRILNMEKCNWEY